VADPIELHVESREQCGCAGVIAHEGYEIDQSPAAKLLQGPSKGCRRLARRK
jgi:hypothetical protein